MDAHSGSKEALVRSDIFEVADYSPFGFHCQENKPSGVPYLSHRKRSFKSLSLSKSHTFLGITLDALYSIMCLFEFIQY